MPGIGATHRLGWILAISLGLSRGITLAQTPPPPDSPPGQDQKPDEAKALGMSPAIACLRVDGLEQYTPLPEATLTSADKLKVYFRPLRYKVETDPTNKNPYRAKFVEDGRIRRKGEKNPLVKEDKLLEYETRFAQADWQIYLVNTIGLEKLTPGEYELDITLHDAIDGDATARQTLAFRIVPIPDVTEAPPAPEPAQSKSIPTRKPRSGRSNQRPR